MKEFSNWVHAFLKRTMIMRIPQPICCGIHMERKFLTVMPRLDYRSGLRSASRRRFGRAPTTREIISPFRKTLSVGIASIP